MKAVINVDVPEWQIGQDVSIYFPDSMLKHGKCLLKEEQETEWEHLWDAPDGTFKGRCKKCGFVHFFLEGHDTQYKFCPECGGSVKLDG